MPFDMGFNFRSTAGYVTDGAEGVPVLGEAYPHTYTNTNGYSINAGFTNAVQAALDLSSTNDPRIAGANRIFTDQPPNPVTTFKADLSSGSGPGAGDYTLDLAEGSPTEARRVDFTVTDTTTVLINGAVGANTSGAGKFYDATLTEVTASTTWTGTPVSKTFTTTDARVNMGVTGVGGWLSYLAHFRLTLVEEPPTDTLFAQAIF